jgi:hypothetical protein
MNGRPPTKKELNQQERKVMKVAGEKLVLYTGREEVSRVLGDGGLIKVHSPRWMLPGYLSRASRPGVP